MKSSFDGSRAFEGSSWGKMEKPSVVASSPVVDVLESSEEEEYHREEEAEEEEEGTNNG